MIDNDVNSKLNSMTARCNLLLSISHTKIWRLKLNYITKFICNFIWLLKLICCCNGRS